MINGPGGFGSVRLRQYGSRCHHQAGTGEGQRLRHSGSYVNKDLFISLEELNDCEKKNTYTCLSVENLASGPREAIKGGAYLTMMDS